MQHNSSHNSEQDDLEEKRGQKGMRGEMEGEEGQTGMYRVESPVGPVNHCVVSGVSLKNQNLSHK